MSTTWIIIANSSKAFIYQTHLAKLFIPNGHDESNIKLIGEFNHNASRKKTNELVTDKRGRYQARSVSRGAYESTSDPKHHEADNFAKELVDYLNKARIKSAYDYLVIVATPVFQGLISQHLQSHSELARMVSQRIEKDYTQLQGRQLVAQLRENL